MLTRPAPAWRRQRRPAISRRAMAGPQTRVPLGYRESRRRCAGRRIGHGSPPPLASPHGSRARRPRRGEHQVSPDQVRVLVLYSHPLMGEGLGRMLAAEPGVVVTAVDIGEPDAVNAALAERARGHRGRGGRRRRRRRRRPPLQLLARPGRGHHDDQRLDAPPRDALHPPGRLPRRHPRRHRRRRAQANRTAACSRRRFRARLSPDMGDTPPARRRQPPAFDPRTTPVPRRRVLVLMGAGTVAATGGLGALLAGLRRAAGHRGLDVTPTSSWPGPRWRSRSRSSRALEVAGSTWLVKKAPARSSRSTRAAPTACAATAGPRKATGSSAAATTASSRWTGRSSPGRRRGRWPLPVRVVGDAIEVDVPGDFETPKESLPACRAGSRARPAVDRPATTSPAVPPSASAAP